jgi:hypothetical protein
MTHIAHCHICDYYNYINTPWYCPYCYKEAKNMPPEQVNHPTHYGGDTPYETIKVLKAWLTPEQLYGFCLGNAIKYQSRAGKKSSSKEEDLKKSQWYLNYILENLSDNAVKDQGNQTASEEAHEGQKQVSQG